MRVKNLCRLSGIYIQIRISLMGWMIIIRVVITFYHIRPDALSVPKRLAESGYDIKTNAARLTDMYAALISKNSQ